MMDSTQVFLKSSFYSQFRKKQFALSGEIRPANQSRCLIVRRVANWLLFPIGCGLCLVLSGCTGDIVSRSAPLTLTVSADSINVGNVPVGKNASATLSLFNKNPVAVNITQLSLTGQSFSIGNQISLPVLIAAGSTYTLDIDFVPAALGPAAGQLKIASDASTDGTMIVSVSGVGVRTAAQSASGLSGFTCSSGSVTGSGTDACTVTISAVAPSGGFKVNLSSSNAAVTVPATVTIPANATSAQFTANLSSVPTSQLATLSASASGTSENFALQLNAYAPILKISSTSVAFGNVALNTATTQSITLTSTGTAPVTVSAATPTGRGFSVPNAAFPITLHPGMSTTLHVQFDPTTAGTAGGQLTFTSNAYPDGTAVINLSGTGGTPAISSVHCGNGEFTGSGTDACTVSLNGFLESSTQVVSLSSTDPAISIPATVTVLGNATSANFMVTVSPVLLTHMATVTASADGTSMSVAIKLIAYIPTLKISTANLAFADVPLNTAATQTVNLTSTGTAPLTISALKVSGAGFSVSGATLPLTMNPNQTTALTVQFNPAATGAATGQLAVISNANSSGSGVINLSGTGGLPALKTFQCNKGQLTGSGTALCTVSLNGFSESSAQLVTLLSTDPAVTIPATVTVPENISSAAFQVTISSVLTAKTVTLTASAGGTSMSFNLSLNAFDPILKVGSTSLAFAVVPLDTVVTKSVTLSSTGTAPLTINLPALTGAGFSVSGATFPLTLSPNQTVALIVQFDPAATGAVAGQLTITSNAYPNPTTVIELGGTGGVPGTVVAVTPPNTTMTAGASQQFAAATLGTSNSPINWAISGAGCTGTACGTISLSGLYTAPTAVPTPASVTVTASSEADQSDFASANVTVVAFSPTTYYLATAADGGNDRNNGLSADAPWLTPKHSVNCGDEIIAEASSAYSSANFETGRWGTVNCPSGNNVAWLKCTSFDACKITASSGAPGFYVDKSYWGVQGWEVTASDSTSNWCFGAVPNHGTPEEIHHIIFANNVANGCQSGGFVSFGNQTASVDYLAIVGNIAYNAAQGSENCASGISVYEPIQSDSLPGTHIYVAGNFAWGNVDPDPCFGEKPSDGEGIIFDTFDGSQGGLSAPYAAQAVADNNVLIDNGGRGLQAFGNIRGSGPFAQIYFRHNTAWGNNGDLNDNIADCGEIHLSNTLNTQAFLNLASTNATEGCASRPIYAYFVVGGDESDQVYQNWGYAASGTNSGMLDSTGFSYEPDNSFGTDPIFANPTAPQPPACGGYSSVPACMATVSANFTPTNLAASGFGYQIPSATPVFDPLFPQWLCSADLPAGLVTMGCKTVP